MLNEAVRVPVALVVTEESDLTKVPWYGTDVLLSEPYPPFLQPVRPENEIEIRHNGSHKKIFKKAFFIIRRFISDLSQWLHSDYKAFFIKKRLRAADEISLPGRIFTYSFMQAAVWPDARD